MVVPLFIYTKDKPVLFFPNRNDKIYFELTDLDKPIIKKVYGYNDINKINGEIKIRLESSDTYSLEKGTYSFSVKLLRKDPWKDEPDNKGVWETIVNKNIINII